MFSLISKGKQMPSKSQSFSRHQYRSLAFCPLSNVSLQPLPLTRGVFRGGAKGARAPLSESEKMERKKGRKKVRKREKDERKGRKEGKKQKNPFGLV